MRRTIFILMCLFCLFLSDICFAEGEKPLVKLETSFGDIVLELDYENAPITVTNFLGYVNSGFYDGLIFHRVIDGFMIQGGGYDADLNEKETGDPIINESYNGLSNVRGTIAMARTSDPNSATSQFFINQDPNDNTDLDKDPNNYGYCVFGRVISDMNVVDTIADVNTGDAYSPSLDRWFQDVPNVPPGPIVINSASQYFGIGGDFDKNNNVNFLDMAMLANDWLEGSEPELIGEMNRGESVDVHGGRRDMSGTIYVWEDDRNDPNLDIYGYDIVTDTEFAISTADRPQIMPAVSGDIVVWRDYRNYGVSGTDIYGADISNINNIREFAICTASERQTTPAVDGNTVVWDDYRRGLHDIYGADISDINNINEFVISDHNSNQLEPSVSGEIVVWCDDRGGNFDIYGYNLATETEFAICEDLSDQYGPKVSGNTVIWTDERNSGTDIYGADISDVNDIKEFAVARGIIADYDIDGNFVIWGEQRNSEWNIYGADISEANNPIYFVVCEAEENQAEPVISGGLAVWRDWRDVEGDLYWRQLCDQYYKGDVNYDCKVDVNDLAVIGENWLSCEF